MIHHGNQCVAAGIIITDSLPSTITMSPIFTQAAKGSLTIALFNACLSSLISIFMCPALVYIQLGSSIQVNYLQLIITLCEIVVGPIFGGLLVQWAMSYTKITVKIKSYFDRLGIINKFCLIILTYIIFCGLFSSNTATSLFSGSVLAIMTVVLLVLHLIQLALIFGFQAILRVLGLTFKRPAIVAQVYSPLIDLVMLLSGKI